MGLGLLDSTFYLGGLTVSKQTRNYHVPVGVRVTEQGDQVVGEGSRKAGRGGLSAEILAHRPCRQGENHETQRKSLQAEGTASASSERWERGCGPPEQSEGEGRVTVAGTGGTQEGKEGKARGARRAEGTARPAGSIPRDEAHGLDSAPRIMCGPWTGAHGSDIT